MIAKFFHGALFGAAFAALAGGVHAQSGDPMHARLSADRVGDVEPGEYSAGDNLDFTLAPYGDKFLLRFSDAPEIFVLHVDHASLGGRVLKYDYGATSLRVSSWGGMTLYTGTAPTGLPALRIGDVPSAAPLAVSSDDLRNALRDETAHLLYLRRLQIGFAAQGPRLADPDARMYAFDALTNAASGLEQFGAEDAGRTALHKISIVEIAPGGRPGLQLAGHTLRVRFAPRQGYAGLASSQTVARALGKLLSVPYRN